MKEIEYQNLIIKDLLVKTKCCNEPDAAALKQPFSLAFLSMREFKFLSVLTLTSEYFKIF